MNGEQRSDCPGISTENQDCLTAQCAKWSRWSAAECSVTCGSGQSTRTRYCLPGVGECVGDDIKVSPCRKARACEEKTTELPEMTKPLSTTNFTVDLLEPDVKLKLATVEKTENSIYNFSDCQTNDENLLLSCKNETCYFSCPENFQMIGNEILRCYKAKNLAFWNATSPKCIQKCSDESDILLAIDEIETERQASYLRQFVRKLVEHFPVNAKRTRVS